MMTEVTRHDSMRFGEEDGDHRSESTNFTDQSEVAGMLPLTLSGLDLNHSRRTSGDLPRTLGDRQHAKQNGVKNGRVRSVSGCSSFITLTSDDSEIRTERQTEAPNGRIGYGRSESHCSLSGTDSEFVTGSVLDRKRRHHRSSNSPAMLLSSVARHTTSPSPGTPVFAPTPSGTSTPRFTGPSASQPPDQPPGIAEQLETELSVSTTPTTSIRFCSMSSEEKFTVITFCLTNFCVGAFYSLLAPFFPTEAAKKGASSTIVGCIFAIFEFTLVVTAPIFGTFLTRIGARFLYVAGVLFCGSNAILFGMLDECPDGVVYIVMCFVIRFFEALGASAFSTASFAIMAKTFPDNIASMFGSLELFSGLGFMVGPPIGGALFTAGGFKLPFMSLGAVVILVGIASGFLLPKQDVEQLPSHGSVWSLLKIPIIPIVGVCLLFGAGCLGFFDVTLSLFLTEKYSLSPLIIGFIFLVEDSIYAFTAPVWGWVVDKYPRYNRTLICVGYTVSGIALFFVGPAPFLHIPHTLWLTVICLAVVGFGVATLVIAFPVMSDAALASGHPDVLATYGLVAGVFNSFFSLGACAGPLFGGLLHDQLSFEWAAVIVGSCEIASAAVLLVYILISSGCYGRRRAPYYTTDLTEKTEIEKQPLIGNGPTR